MPSSPAGPAHKLAILPGDGEARLAVRMAIAADLKSSCYIHDLFDERKTPIQLGTQ